MVPYGRLTLTAGVPFVRRAGGRSGGPYHACGVINGLVTFYYGAWPVGQDMASKRRDLMRSIRMA